MLMAKDKKISAATAAEFPPALQAFFERAELHAQTVLDGGQAATKTDNFYGDRLVTLTDSERRQLAHWFAARGLYAEVTDGLIGGKCLRVWKR